MHRFFVTFAGATLTLACAPSERSNSVAWMPAGPSGSEQDDDDDDDDDGAAADDDDDHDDGGDNHADDAADDAGDDAGDEPSSTDGDDPPDGGSTSGADLPPESPYQGGWSVGDCQGDIVAGGNVIDDITLVDQYGDSVRLYDFCHLAVLFVGGALW